MKTTNYTKFYKLSAMVVLIFIVGCSTIKPTPEAAALADTRPWGAAPTPTPEEQYPFAEFIAGLLRFITR